MGCVVTTRVAQVAHDTGTEGWSEDNVSTHRNDSSDSMKIHVVDPRGKHGHCEFDERVTTVRCSQPCVCVQVCNGP